MENRSLDPSGHDSEERVSNTFIISWDMTGLEAVVDITQDLIDGEQWEKEVLFDVIKDPDNSDLRNEAARKVSNIIQMMTLRARANPQRHYEIYCLNTTAEITKADLDRYFEDNPQATADLIRERGRKLYSDRLGKMSQVIV